MKGRMIFSVNYPEGLMHVGLLAFRVMVSAMMLTHGWPKLERLVAGGELNFPDPLGVGSFFSLLLVVFAEFLCSLFVILGLATRLSLIPQIITMAVAVFVVHAGDVFAKKEMGLLYLAAYVLLLITGPGRYSADRLFRK